MAARPSGAAPRSKPRASVRCRKAHKAWCRFNTLNCNKCDQRGHIICKVRGSVVLQNYVSDESDDCMDEIDDDEGLYATKGNKTYFYVFKCVCVCSNPRDQQFLGRGAAGAVIWVLLYPALSQPLWPQEVRPRGLWNIYGFALSSRSPRGLSGRAAEVYAYN